MTMDHLTDARKEGMEMFFGDGYSGFKAGWRFGMGVDEAQDWLRASTRNLIAAIIQYVGNMPELSEWRNARRVAPAGSAHPLFRPTLEVRTRLVETR